MKKFIKKQWGVLAVILMISSISTSFADKPESDAEQDFGRPAGTAGHVGNRDHGEDSIKAQSSSLSKSGDRQGIEFKPDSDAEQGIGRPAGTAGRKPADLFEQNN